MVMERVDREVATMGVFADGAEAVVPQHQTFFGLVAVIAVVAVVMATKGGDFDDLATHAHVHDLEAATNDPGPAEHLADFFGGGVGGDIEILGLQAEQPVAHTAAYRVGRITCAVELFHHRATTTESGRA